MACDNLIIDGVLFNYAYSKANVNIDNGCIVPKKFFSSTLSWIREKHGYLKVWKRSEKSLKREWAYYNLRYSLGRAKNNDVEFTCETKWYVSLIGAIALLFIK